MDCKVDQVAEFVVNSEHSLTVGHAVGVCNGVLSATQPSSLQLLCLPLSTHHHTYWTVQIHKMKLFITLSCSFKSSSNLFSISLFLPPLIATLKNIIPQFFLATPGFSSLLQNIQTVRVASLVSVNQFFLPLLLTFNILDITTLAKWCLKNRSPSFCTHVLQGS